MIPTDFTPGMQYESEKPKEVWVQMTKKEAYWYLDQRFQWIREQNMAKNKDKKDKDKEEEKD